MSSDLRRSWPHTDEHQSSSRMRVINYNWLSISDINHLC